MINILINRVNSKRSILFFGFIFVFVQMFSAQTFAQKSKSKVPAKTAKVAANNVANLPKVTQIDEVALKSLLKREGANTKPLLINFWATWCDPCREEFPELVKIDEDYKGKIDFITISLDDLAEIKRDVPKFLVDMKAKMPAYLLKTDNEEAAIASVTKDWQGGLPFTVLLNEKGEIAYVRQGKIKTETVRAEIDKILTSETVKTLIIELPKPKDRSSEQGKEDAKNDIAGGVLKIKRYGLTAAIPQELIREFKEKYDIDIVESGCVLINVTAEYFDAYNSLMKAEISNRFGVKIFEKLPS